jgi:hypothetical protein
MNIYMICLPFISKIKLIGENYPDRCYKHDVSKTPEF